MFKPLAIKLTSVRCLAFSEVRERRALKQDLVIQLSGELGTTPAT